MRKLVLFDIDGTLITDGGASRDAFASALLEVFDYEGDLRRSFVANGDRVATDDLRTRARPLDLAVQPLADVGVRAASVVGQLLEQRAQDANASVPGVSPSLSICVATATTTSRQESVTSRGFQSSAS